MVSICSFNIFFYKYTMKILHLGLGLVLWCTEFFNVSDISFIFFFLCCLCFWYEVISHCGLGLNSFIFIYLPKVLVVAHRIFNLCCGMWHI